MSLRAVSLGVCVVLALSCSDDDDNASYRVPYQSGVTAAGTIPGTTPVSTLGDAELRQLCTSFDAHVEAQVGFEAIAYIACLPQAIVLGGNPAGCEQRLSECMSVFPEPIEIETQLRDETVCFSNLRACEAGVAALEGCVNVNLDLLFEILDNWTCGNASDESGRAEAESVMDTLSVCADLSAGCNRFATVDVQ